MCSALRNKERRHLGKTGPNPDHQNTENKAKLYTMYYGSANEEKLICLKNQEKQNLKEVIKNKQNKEQGCGQPSSSHND